MAGLQLQIMSDLHLETPKARPSYEDFEIQPECPYLALLGDVGNVVDPQLFDFFRRQLLHFETIFYLLGNHEPYGITFAEASERVRLFEAEVEQQRRDKPDVSMLGRFVFLERSRYDISKDMTIFGCTLFSAISQDQRDSVAQFVSDFSDIKEWTIDSHIASHQADLQWLDSQVAHCAQTEPHRSMVVLTHHSPTMLANANGPDHVKDRAQIRSAFTTDLSNNVCWTTPQVKLWAFGHTHYNCDIRDPRTRKRIIANQKGYRRAESPSFSRSKVVEVEVDWDSDQEDDHVQKMSSLHANKDKHCTVS